MAKAAVTDDELDTFVRLYGCGTKLKREVMRHLRWRDVDWYRNWPTFGALSPFQELVREVFRRR